MSTTIQRSGPPAHVGTQRERVLQLLRQAGPDGIRRDTFIFAHGITQPGARVAELLEEGFVISSRRAQPDDSFVTYYLEREPEVRKQVPRYTRKQKTFKDDGGTDWYVRLKGEPRPSGLSEPPPGKLPLFEGAQK